MEQMRQHGPFFSVYENHLMLRSASETFRLTHRFSDRSDWKISLRSRHLRFTKTWSRFENAVLIYIAWYGKRYVWQAKNK